MEKTALLLTKIFSAVFMMGAALFVIALIVAILASGAIAYVENRRHK